MLGLVIINLSLNGQNLDLHTKYNSGKYYGMAGSGAGIAGGIHTMDINPAGISFSKRINYSFSYNLNLYDYYLTRTNPELLGTYEYDWIRLQHNFNNLSVVIPSTGKFSFGAGIINKLSPYLQNERRALTMSKLFEQESSGGIYAIMLSTGYKISDRISAGINLYGYYGASHSEIHGDLHGADLEKWAILKIPIQALILELDFYINGKLLMLVWFMNHHII